MTFIPSDSDSAMGTGHSVQLLSLLAEYATKHGRDCPPEMTLVDLANDLCTSLNGEYSPQSRLEEWRDEVELGMTDTVR